MRVHACVHAQEVGDSYGRLARMAGVQEQAAGPSSADGSADKVEPRICKPPFHSSAFRLRRCS